jgi:PLP dependent protein
MSWVIRPLPVSGGLFVGENFANFGLKPIIMPVNLENYRELLKTLGEGRVLVAVSKTKPATDIMELYQAGQRDFGENYVQELLEKHSQLPADIRWHFIGHLQSNKVKFLIPFVYLIHGVDSLRLLQEIERQAARIGRKIRVLLQVHISEEETKFGFDASELATALDWVKQQARAGNPLAHVQILGLMGMASFSEDPDLLKREFSALKQLFDQYRGQSIAGVDFRILSMGMSGDYPLALDNGSTMVRVGSLLFGSREKK